MRKIRFEALAELVLEESIAGSGANYYRGWIAQGSSDQGIDLVGRLDVGSCLSTTSLILLGQAKCEKLDRPTGGNHIARIAARLRQGYVGAYVTTSYFSRPVQKEVLQDGYPVMLIAGKSGAESVETLMFASGLTDPRDVNSFLSRTDATYESRLVYRNPEEILLD